MRIEDAQELTILRRFAKEVRQAFVDGTDDDGWDVDIMTDVARAMIRAGIAHKDEEIVS